MSVAMAKPGILPQRLKPQFGEPETAGINACFTRWLRQDPVAGISGVLMTIFAGAKAQTRKSLNAALKGRSFTRLNASSLRSPLPEGRGWGRASIMNCFTGGR